MDERFEVSNEHKSILESKKNDSEYEAISCLRIMLSTHPLAKDVEIPEYLQQEKGIVFY